MPNTLFLYQNTEWVSMKFAVGNTTTYRLNDYILGETGTLLLLLLVYVSSTVTGQPQNSVFIHRV